MRTEYDDVIRAWLDGAEVVERHGSENRWIPFAGIFYTNDHDWQCRLAKPAKEPKYLWVYGEYLGATTICIEPIDTIDRYLGKIRLEE